MARSREISYRQNENDYVLITKKKSLLIFLGNLFCTLRYTNTESWLLTLVKSIINTHEKREPMKLKASNNARRVTRFLITVTEALPTILAIVLRNF